jgi:type VI secretion system protein ImpM
VPDLVTGPAAEPVAAAHGGVGFFGKLPARGDFVRRDLPQDFVDAWDAWLAAGIAASRAQLGTEWLPAFLEAPIWNFTLAPGIAGGGVAGIFLPSVDRAGRYFPLTLAAGTPHAPFLIAAPDWFAALAAAGVSALSEEASLEAFEATVSALPSPPVPGLPRPFAGGLAAPTPAGLLGATAPGALFWTAGGARVAARVAALPSLPPAEAFAGLLCDPAAAQADDEPPLFAPLMPPGGDALFGDAR